MLMFKVKNNMLPLCVSAMFKLQSDVHVIQTRQAHLFHLPFCRTEKKRKSICYFGPYIWNNFIIQNCAIDKSIVVFKKSLRSINSHYTPL